MDDDPLIVWARQDDKPGVRVFRAPDAVAVAVPALSRRDRLAVAGRPAAVAGLLADVLPEVGPTFRPLGDEDLIAAVARRVDGIEMAGRFMMMDTAKPAPGAVLLPAAEPSVRAEDPRPSGAERGAWLDDVAGVADFLREAFPDSYARPGEPGVLRWAGVRDEDGKLLATAADAWSVRDVGFIAGVATHPAARGTGLASALCAFVTNDMLRTHRRVALFADHWNEAALRTYRRLGFTQRPLAAAEQVSSARGPGAR